MLSGGSNSRMWDGHCHKVEGSEAVKVQLEVFVFRPSALLLGADEGGFLVVRWKCVGFLITTIRERGGGLSFRSRLFVKGLLFVAGGCKLTSPPHPTGVAESLWSRRA